MRQSATITTAPPSNHGLDYSWLRAEGARLTQALSGDEWTDYNEHDPGVTTLEQLCYALTDLSYRAGLPMAELLADRRGVVEPRRQAMFLPKRILPCNPVTVNDYRKLFVDRLPEVGNVWLTPHVPDEKEPVQGLYDIEVYAPGMDPCDCEGWPDKDRIAADVRRVFAHHRNLCEDARTIEVLTPIRTSVAGLVTLDEGGCPDEVMARVLFAVATLLAPEVPRRSLRALLDEGLTPAAVFEGPLLHNGFVDDGALGARARQIWLRDVIGAIVRAPGVASVRDVSVRTGDVGKEEAAGNLIVVPDGCILVLDTRAHGGKFGLRLSRRGVECRPDPAKVKARLEQLFASYRRTYPLEDDYEALLGLPRGRHRELTRYSSVQLQYPITYGIGAFGLPDGAGERRRAEARQLKGYLLVFEQVLADFFAQLARARDLFSTDAALEGTYFWQSLRERVPDVEALLGPDYEARLAEVVKGMDPAVERRNRFLDFLLALHARRLASSGTTSPCDCGASGTQGEDLSKVKRALLDALVTITRDRGQGFDYEEDASPHNTAGMGLEARIVLGRRMYFVEHTLLRFAREAAGAAAHVALPRAPVNGCPPPRPPAPFEYSFTVTVVMASESAGDEGVFRGLAEEALRELCPAHVVLELLFLRPLMLQRFERIRDDWHAALRSGEEGARARQSARLRDFLLRHPPTERA